MKEAIDVLRWFVVARQVDRIRNRAALEARQQRLFRKLQRRVLRRSPYYAAMSRRPFEDYPVIGKSEWLGRFDTINTHGVRFEDALAAAEDAEASRNFAKAFRGLTVGLSTGTSGRRSVFLVTDDERRRWAGLMMARLFPDKPLRHRRIAFFLRANSRLYETAAESGRITFRYFDLLAPWPDLVEDLGRFAPDVVVAPPSVLRRLAEEKLRDRLSIAPERTVSIAETLFDDDRREIESAFDCPLGEVYQATEGALAITCERGALHLNEGFLRIEREWIDQRRFVPIVTDLTRAAQPVVRYRLDDVLVEAERPCGCGRATVTIEAIEGRCDDVLSLPSPAGGTVAIYPDFVVRAVLGAHAGIRDFVVSQTGPATLTLALDGPPEARDDACRALAVLVGRCGATTPDVTREAYRPPALKRRRVVNAGR